MAKNAKNNGRYYFMCTKENVKESKRGCRFDYPRFSLIHNFRGFYFVMIVEIKLLYKTPLFYLKYIPKCRNKL